MEKCKIYDTNNPDDMKDLELRYNVAYIEKMKSIMEVLVKKEQEKKPKAVKSHDHPPCQCGSIDFLRTGTCFVCQICGTSQGCS